MRYKFILLVLFVVSVIAVDAISVQSLEEPIPDVNGDGEVNILDIVIVGQHFGEAHIPLDPAITGIYYVTDYGALGDGINDDTAAFQAAIDAAAVDGGMVLVPLVGGGKGYVLTETIYLT